MERNFPEPDWKILSKLKPLALDRLCQRILMTSEDIIVRVKEGGYYNVYLELYKHIQTNDETLSNCFNDWKRSQVFFILASWRRENLISEDEFTDFSGETRAVVKLLLSRG